jgi:predicted methyltransferase
MGIYIIQLHERGIPMKFLMNALVLACLAVAATAQAGGVDSERLAEVLAQQSEDTKARYAYRHPQETLEFFGIEPGMLVVEALPGQGWYSKILLPYLGSEGQLIGADYSMDMYPLFGFFSEERLEKQSTWVQDFPEGASEWAGENGACVAAFSFGTIPEHMKGVADAVLLIRALHNLARFESEGDFMTAALTNVHDSLKPGGIVGVVQHEAPENMPDEWAGGQNGYLKKSFVIAKMEEFGFEYVGSSDVNQNGRDRPTESDAVWRLPPTLSTSRDNPELRAQMQAIGESNRMTLKFRKPE